MNQSNHDRSPLARISLAAGGIGVLTAVAALARYAAGSYGTLAGILVVAAAFAGCGLAFRPRTRRAPRPQRPAPVRLPVPAREACEPVKSLT